MLLSCCSPRTPALLLDVMEALTEAYEQAAQMLTGDRMETSDAPGTPPATGL